MKSLRSLITSLLLMALPLQGQAAAAMTCHGSTPANVGSHTNATKAPEHHTHAHAAHASHLAEAADPVTNSSRSAHPGACALCAATCFMAYGLPAQAALTFTEAAFHRPSPGPTADFASVVLEGLLRPPRI
jgi:hypothetical protein